MCYLPLTVIKCGLVSDISVDSWVWTKATCAVICCEFELFGEEATEFVGKMVETVIGASSGESDWSIGTTSIIETPSDVVPVCKIYFFCDWNIKRKKWQEENDIKLKSQFNAFDWFLLMLISLFYCFIHDFSFIPVYVFA